MRRPAFCIMDYEKNRLEENLDRDVIEGYQPKSWIKDLPLDCFFPAYNFIKRPWMDRISAPSQPFNVHRRYSKINNIPEFEYRVATPRLGRGFVAYEGVFPVIEH